MKNVRRTLVAAPLALAISLGIAGVAGAQTVDYTPEVETEVLGVTQEQAVAVTASGTLPYTGNDSSLPLAEVGAGLLAVGGLTVVMVRRQQAKSEA